MRHGGNDEFDPEHAALADAAFHADRAAHQFHQALGHHQADTGAFLGAIFPPQAIERLEQLRHLFRRQSRARVPNADAHALRGARAAFDGDGALGPVVLDRVGQQVDQDLLHADAVGIDEAGYVDRGKRDADAVFFRLRFDHGLAFEHHVGERDRLARP